MKLIEDWKMIVTRAWSIRLIVLAMICIAASVALSLANATMLGVTPMTFAIVSGVLNAAAFVARIWAQTNVPKMGGFFADETGAVRKRVLAGALAATMALAVPLTAHWEGMRTEAYRDIVGVWTVCAGETKGVKPGDRYTVAQCNAMLSDRVAEFYAGVERCAPQIAAAPVEVRAAVTSWAYNVGLGAACGSTLAKRVRAGDFKAACNELPRWNRAGGRAIQGLTNRRGGERALCLSGL